jgi:hypothetical protein
VEIALHNFYEKLKQADYQTHYFFTRQMRKKSVFSSFNPVSRHFGPLSQLKERKTRRSEWKQEAFLTRRNEGSEEHEGANGSKKLF